jgi:hypothetical protein
MKVGVTVMIVVAATVVAPSIISAPEIVTVVPRVVVITGADTSQVHIASGAAAEKEGADQHDAEPQFAKDISHTP